MPFHDDDISRLVSAIMEVYSGCCNVKGVVIYWDELENINVCTVEFENQLMYKLQNRIDGFFIVNGSDNIMFKINDCEFKMSYCTDYRDSGYDTCFTFTKLV